MYRRTVAVDGMGVGWELDRANLRVHVAPNGRLTFAGPGRAVSRVAVASSRRPAAAEEWSAEELAVIAECRAQLAELQSRAYPVAPDAAELLASMLRRLAPGIELAGVGIALEATGIVPLAAADAALVAATAAVRFFTGRGAAAGGGAEHARRVGAQRDARILQSLCWIAIGIFESIALAARIDDAALEDELDAFYPYWSRTDFEWDPRRYRRGHRNRVRNSRYRGDAGPVPADAVAQQHGCPGADRMVGHRRERSPSVRSRVRRGCGVPASTTTASRGDRCVSRAHVTTRPWTHPP